jgi:hypothetical protein
MRMNRWQIFFADPEVCIHLEIALDGIIERESM